MEEASSTLLIRCPFCDSATMTKVYPETVLIHFPLYCPQCDREIIVNVVNRRMVISDEHDK